MDRPGSRDGIEKDSAESKSTAFGRGVSPAARILRYLGAPT